TVTNTTTIYPMYVYNNSSSTRLYGKSVYLTGNEITATSTGTMYCYVNYGSYLTDTRVNNNKITLNGGTGTQYLRGAVSYAEDGVQFNGNTIKMTGTSTA